MLHEEVLCNEVHVLVRARSREWQIPVLLPFSFLFFAPLEQVCIGRAITRRVDLLGRSLSRSGYDLVGFSLMGIGGKWRIFTETCKGRTAAEGTSHCFLKSPGTNRLRQRAATIWKCLNWLGGRRLLRVTIPLCLVWRDNLVSTSLLYLAELVRQRRAPDIRGKHDVCRRGAYVLGEDSGQSSRKR